MKTKCDEMKIKIGLLFGGKSAEHDISIISAIQALNNIPADKYLTFPIYISKSGEMYCGNRIGKIEAYRDIPALLAASDRVSLIRKDGAVKLISLNAPRRRAEITEIDVALPVVHGTNTEDGTLQGYLRLLGLPFAGCDVMASAMGMDKYVSKIILQKCGIPVLDCVRLSAAEYRASTESAADLIEKKISYPVIVKPINCGSSIGISKAENRDELFEALDDAFCYADSVIAERAVTSLREINCSVLGDSDHAEASECEEPVAADKILSFKDKYLSSGGSKGGAKTESASEGMASLKRIIPAPIPPERRKEIREMAVMIFRELGCSGVVRIDFLIDTDADKVYFNEINTIPGSLSFYLWEPVGVKYPDLLDRLITLALRRHRKESTLTYTFESSVLSGISFGGTKGAKQAK